MERRTSMGAIVAIAFACGTAAAHASPPGVVIQSARTVAESVRDGVLTLGRTTRAFVLGGTEAAQDTWYENADATRERARRNVERVREEAGMARVDPQREYRGYDDNQYDRDGGRGDRGSDDDYERRDEPLPPAVPDDGY
jgi:hypothetical protein